MRKLTCLLPVLGLASGCTVYVPMQATMPLVRAKGELEATASLQPNGRLEATAAYSPLAHCVVAGAGTVGFRLGQESFLITRQAEGSLGSYWGLGDKWLLNAMAGGGYAYTDRRDAGLFGGYERRTGTYAKAFGQLGLAYDNGWGSLSLSYRLAQVQYYGVQEDDRPPLASFGSQRHEVLLAARRYLGGSPRWQLQTAVGYSASSLPPPSSGSQQPNSDRWYSAGIPVFLYSVGVVWQPGRQVAATQ